MGDRLTPGEILAQQSVGVLVAAPLPGAGGVTKENLNTGVDGEANVLFHFSALVPGQGAAQVLRQRADLFCQTEAGALSVDAPTEPLEHHLASAPLHHKVYSG